MTKCYRICHLFTGYTFGYWLDREAAECYRESLDDWMDWVVESC